MPTNNKEGSNTNPAAPNITPTIEASMPIANNTRPLIDSHSISKFSKPIPPYLQYTGILLIK